jgi:hypothetical protein
MLQAEPSRGHASPRLLQQQSPATAAALKMVSRAIADRRSLGGWIYAAIIYSEVQDGLASAFLNTANVDATIGVSGWPGY